MATQEAAPIPSSQTVLLQDGPAPAIPEQPELVYQKKDTGYPAQEYIAYASKISNNDLDFILTLNAENGDWSPDRWATNGEPSRGFCQFHASWHSDVLNDPNFLNPQWQLDKCYEAYKGGTRFYGYDVRMKAKDDFYLTSI